MSLDTLYPEAPQAIDMREPEKAQKAPFKVNLPKMEGANLMNTTHFEIFNKVIGLYLMLSGAWATGWGAYSYLSPDDTFYKNLKGAAPIDRAYLKSFLDDCSMTNFFDDKMDKCHVSASAYATLIKGEPVIAHVDEKDWTLATEPPKSANAPDSQPGNAESPAE